MELEIISFNDARGFGFAVTPQNKHVFIHYSQIQMTGRKTLKQGMRVFADLYETSKGLEGKNVRILE